MSRSTIHGSSGYSSSPTRWTTSGCSDRVEAMLDGIDALVEGRLFGHPETVRLWNRAMRELAAVMAREAEGDQGCR